MGYKACLVLQINFNEIHVETALKVTVACKRIKETQNTPFIK